MGVKNISIVTLGCSKNEIDSELMMGLLRKNNYIITNSLEKADIIIINTCCFIQDAKEESIETIWEMTKYKNTGNCKYLILAGCLAERYSKELLKEINEVDAIIGTGNIKDIVDVIDSLEKGEKRVEKTKNINENYLEEIKRTNFKSTEYVKISEGCNNYCSYCIIPRLRGKYRSRKIEDIIKEVSYMAENGVKEVILIAQNTADYGIDLYGDYKLAELLKELNAIKNLQWIRLLYLYPDNFTDDLIYAIKTNEKVVKYVDIPLQHISNPILNKMNRKTSKEDIINLISKLRKEIPNIIIRTTFIVGFPGEEEIHFQELYNFVKNIKFDKLGVFTYSREEGTPAYNFDSQVEEIVKQNRRNKLMELQQKISYELNQQKIGKVYLTLVEEICEEGIYIGRTYMDSPEIDGFVYIYSNKELDLGEYVYVKIIDCLEYDLIGEMVDEFSK
ncbi:ribosomal protein S12 methylthiotransferase [Keratinibaculum paraultunense]|uniref:Ribosomal protein uS12 methylthiotransferase RimO n=1 Tax=Keratinibaculum paraultunense TaxID=1278232 RepID=A0A4R3L023_9FIRM|nr:30S ribosomal protein S12 methylthiotransferase RimO [Keratinibaculum paraultunense]QQY80683.1 30S ribosomal protein S12 methylthiotransferase RimO [Keratinibaculum paraultunense]TCS89714.1 ribosomal protein S12 methylthiotransferase [Keratinibaculum paraultunense]